MNKNLAIGLGVLGVIGFGVGIYLYTKNNKKNSSTKTTSSDFDDLVKVVKENKGDIFDNISNQKLSEIKNNFIKNVSKKDAEDFKALVIKGEKNWTASDKIKFFEIFGKISGKKIV